MIPSDLAARLRMLTEASFFTNEPQVPGLARAREVQSDLPDLLPGQRFTATIQRALPDGSFQAIVAGRVYTLALNHAANPGDTLELVVTQASPRAVFAQRTANETTAPAPAAAPATSQSTLSATGRLIGYLLTGQPEPKPASLSGGQPLLPAPPTTGAALAPLLRQALGQSGLFYESHQARWVGGTMSLAGLTAEPQGQQAPTARPAGASPPATPGTPPSPAGQAGLPPSSAPSGQAGAPPAAVPAGQLGPQASTTPTSPPGQPAPSPPAGQAPAQNLSSPAGQPASGFGAGGNAVTQSSTLPGAGNPPPASAAPSTAAAAGANTPPPAGLPPSAPPPWASAPQAHSSMAPPPGAPPGTAGAEHGAVRNPVGDSGQGTAPTRVLSPSGPAETARFVRDIAGEFREVQAAGQTAAEQAKPLGIPERLLPIVHQQLDALATHQLVVNAQAWPGQTVAWEIEDPSGDAESNGGDEEGSERNWRSTLRLSLPRLGGVEAHLELTPAGVAVRLRAEDANTLVALGAEHDTLEAALAAADVPLTGFVVEAKRDED